jgi:conjugative relaxase-like TrwC/TraI family protein
VICSVTVLGARGRTVGAVAADVVAYLEGQRTERGGSRGGTTTELPSLEGGLTTYYADSAGEGPGTWMGRGIDRLGLSGDVVGVDLHSVLSGLDPRTHEDLVGAQGSAGRAGGPSRRLDNRPWWTLRDASEVIGVSPSYLRRLVDQTQTAMAERTFAQMAGQATSPWTSLWLVAEKQGKVWRVSGTELRDYMNMRQPPTVVVGYDVTFSVDKSVSALWARADDAVRAEIIAAVNASVASGMRYLEDQAFRVRVKGVRAPAEGMVAASYLHSTSRALDPQLHRHVVVANLATGPDGETRAVDSPSLFHHAKTAGYVAGAELRHQLTARLGVEWHEVNRGLSDVVGVPEAALVAISTRSAEMASAALAIGSESGGAISTTSPAARHALALATRAPKVGGVDSESLRERWRDTLDVAGLDLETFERALHRVVGPRLVSGTQVSELFALLAGAHGVTETRATFDRRHVVEAVATWSVDRLSAAACGDLADRWLAGPEVVALHPRLRRAGETDVIHRGDGAVISAGAEQLFTTKAMLATEERIETSFLQGRHLGRVIVASEVTEGVLAHPAFANLSNEQADLVRHLTGSGHETGLVHGPAGTGKTTAIEAAARSWEIAGFRVLGASVNGNASEILGRRAGIESSTVASLLLRLEGGDPRVLDSQTVIVLDEASTLATRDLDHLMSFVHQHGAALRLVGDPAQHSAVGAGGAFRWLLEQFPTDVAQLSENHRQVGVDMAEVRLALSEYRDGAVATALNRLEGDQRIVTAASATELFDTLVTDWYGDRQQAQADPSIPASSMTAAHHDERRMLVARARALLQGDGTLHGPELVAAGICFQAGDEVIAKRADRTLRPSGGDRESYIRNGTRGTVMSVGEDHLVVDFEHRGEIRVPRRYLEREITGGVRGALLHSYCLTTYAAQGDTYGAARHLGSDHSSRAELYVGLTRGRHDVALYAVRRSDVQTPLLEDDLPRLRDETNAARAMASSAAAGGVERLAREMVPLVIKAGVLPGTAVPAWSSVIDSDRSAEPPMRSPHGPKADVLAAQEGTRPSDAVLQFLGPRPVASAGEETSGLVPSPEQRWDAAVDAVTRYQSDHLTRPFPGSATDEMIGLRALAPDLNAWDAVNRIVQDYLNIAPDLAAEITQIPGLTIELEM